MVTGPRRYSHDLMQGGLEFPCKYKFTGPDDATKMAHKLLSDEHNRVSELQGIIRRLIMFIAVVIVAGAGPGQNLILGTTLNGVKHVFMVS